MRTGQAREGLTGCKWRGVDDPNGLTVPVQDGWLHAGLLGRRARLHSGPALLTFWRNRKPPSGMVPGAGQTTRVVLQDAPQKVRLAARPCFGERLLEVRP